MRIYFAASLFTQAERTWNRHLTDALKRAMPEIALTMPQDFKTDGKYNDSRRYGDLFRMCVAGIDSAAAVLAILDGAEVDSGVAWEMGYAYALKKPIIGIRTDFRPGADRGVNIMPSRSCRILLSEFAFQEDVELLAKRLARRLRRLGREDSAASAPQRRGGS